MSGRAFSRGAERDGTRMERGSDLTGLFVRSWLAYFFGPDWLICSEFARNLRRARSAGDPKGMGLAPDVRNLTGEEHL